MKLARDQREAELGWHLHPELGATLSPAHIIVALPGNICAWRSHPGAPVIPIEQDVLVLSISS